MYALSTYGQAFMHSTQHSARSSWFALTGAASWEYWPAADGRVDQLLVHQVADPLGCLRGVEQSVWFTARLMLRDGRVWALRGRCERAGLRTALTSVATVLAGQPCIETAFDSIEFLIERALAAGHHGRCVIELDRHPGVTPRTAISSEQLCRLSLHALNIDRVASGQTTLDELPGILSECFRHACSLDDSKVKAWQASLPVRPDALNTELYLSHGARHDCLFVHNYLAARNGDCRNRMQAALAMPWLLPLLLPVAAAPADGAQSDAMAEIVAAIDAGAPLVRAVRKVFEASAGAVRHLAMVAPPSRWKMDSERLRGLLFLLDCLPPERRPINDSEYEALLELANAVHRTLRFGPIDCEPTAAFRICMRNRLRQLSVAGLAAAVFGDTFASLRNALADASDFLAALCESLRETVAIDDVAARLQVLQFCAGLPVGRLLSLSRQWHMQLQVTPGGAAHALTWPPILRHPWRHGQRVIVELNSASQLAAEGEVMEHCVAASAGACADGNCVIVSLRTPSGAVLSTAELRLQVTAPYVRAEQHRAARNGLPRSECADALAALLRHLNSAMQVSWLEERLARLRHQAARLTMRGKDRATELQFSAAAGQAALRLAGLPAFAVLRILEQDCRHAAKQS